MTRILRYLGNREKPEASLYGPVDHVIPRRNTVAPIKYDVSADYAHIPNPMESGLKQEGSLFVPESFAPGRSIWEEGYIDFMSRTVFGASRMFAPMDPPAAPQIESPFEVNMMEALVGWKAWSLENKVLHSVSIPEIAWPVDEPLVAKCAKGCTEVPREHHTCGIYASSDKQQAKSYVDDNEEFFGLVYGWGRYVRGDNGWRSQFAYPKCFYLNADQVELIEPLKKYHIPIYVDQPTKLYDPSEDGYEHRTDEENGNCGALTSSSATEEADACDEED